MAGNGNGGRTGLWPMVGGLTGVLIMLASGTALYNEIHTAQPHEGALKASDVGHLSAAIQTLTVKLDDMSDKVTTWVAVLKERDRQAAMRRAAGSGCD